MFNIFGKKKKSEPPKTSAVDLDKSAARLIERSHDVKLKLEKIELELKSALEAYRLARTQPDKIKAKKKAVDALKKKKMYTAQLQNLEQVSMNVENVYMQTEMAKDNIDIMRTLKHTNDIQKDLLKEMNLENVDDMIDEMQEIKYSHEEFSDAIQKNYEVEVDEADLDQELEQLDYDMKIELDAKELTVPNKRVQNRKEKDEKDLEDFVVK